MKYVAAILLLLLIPVLAHADCMSGAGGVSAKNFGVQGDGTTDDTVGLQKFYLAIEQTTHSMALPGCVPQGNYKITSPLILSDPVANVWARVQGAGEFGPSTQYLVSGNFPARVIVPSDYVTSMGTITGSCLSGSGCNSLTWNANEPYYLNLTEPGIRGTGNANNAMPLNGLANATIRGYFTTAATTGQVYITASTPNSGGSPSGAVELHYTAGGNIAGAFNTAGTNEPIPGSGTVSANTTYYFEEVLDGANSLDCIFFGTPGGTATRSGTRATTGTITQGANEAFILGGLPSQWPAQGMSQKLGDNSGAVSIQDFAIDKVARHACTTASFTAPTGALTFDANTLYGNHFTTIEPGKNWLTNAHTDPTPFVSVDYVNGSACNTCSQFIYNTNYDGNGGGPEIEDETTGNGTISLIDAMAPGTVVRNEQFNGASYMGVQTFNNTYDSYWDNIFVNTSSFAAAGFACGWAIAHGERIKVLGSYYEIAASTVPCQGLIDPIVVPSGTTIAGIYVQPNASQSSAETIINPEIDNEGGNANGIEVHSGQGIVNVFGGTVLGQGTGNPIQIDGGNGLVHLSGSALVNGGGTYNIHYTSCGTEYVALEGVLLTNGGTLTNCSGLISATGGTQAKVTSTNGTTAGSYSSSEPVITPMRKVFEVYLNGYENTTGTPQTITLPVAFATAISAASTVSGNCTGLTASLSTITLPSNMGATQAGLCEFTGY